MGGILILSFLKTLFCGDDEIQMKNVAEFTSKRAEGLKMVENLIKEFRQSRDEM